MRFANIAGRASLITASGAVDVARASELRFPAQPELLYEMWSDFREWAQTVDSSNGEAYQAKDLGAPSPRPSQVFALALNYAPHAAEGGFSPPTEPLVFTKFPSCITGPETEVTIPGLTLDWEIELVVVIGKFARNVKAADAWHYVAGLTAGQDLSERSVQYSGTPPQFSLAKSFRGFGPTGPMLCTPDEFVSPDDLALSSQLNGVTVQSSRTSAMIISMPTHLDKISAICDLRPGDLIFTGTPEGVGHRHDPPRYLQVGDVLTSSIETIGELRQTFRR